ncbi:hypothetical protein GCM10010869_75830 [Mesorhizobium tianshanense]|nr:hypothetical protein GCM10010869_75830 [Mesorhizobium tianshanense]
MSISISLNVSISADVENRRLGETRVRFALSQLSARIHLMSMAASWGIETPAKCQVALWRYEEGVMGEVRLINSQFGIYSM